MLSAYVGVVHPARLVDGQFHYFLGPGGQPYLTLGWLLTPANNELHCRADLAEVHGKTGEDSCSHAFGFADKPKQNVLRTDIVVVESLGFFLG